jgi:uncharacterized protein
VRAILFAIVLSLASATHAIAAGPVPVPALTGRVNDLAGMLSRLDRESISRTLADYEAKTHHQIVVLTVPTLGGERIETFSRRVANSWHIGLKGWDDGILVTGRTGSPLLSPRRRAGERCSPCHWT